MYQRPKNDKTAYLLLWDLINIKKSKNLWKQICIKNQEKSQSLNFWKNQIENGQK